MNHTASRFGRAGEALERATKLAVLGWALAALAVEIWLLRGTWPGLPVLAALGFAATAGLTALNRRAVGVVLAATYVFPVAAFLWVGHYDPLYSAAWMGLLLGAITPEAVRTPWRLPAAWRGALACWALVTIVGASIVFAREIDFTPALFDVTTISNTSRGGWPAFIIRFVLHTALVTIVGILWFDWLVAVPEREFHSAVARPLAASALLLMLVAAYQLFVDVDFLNHPRYAYLTRAGGTMFDANLAGTIAALWIGGGILMAGRRGRRRAVTAAAGAALGWLAVWATGSRTAFAAALIVTAFSLAMLYAAQSAASRARALASAAMAAAAVGIVVFVLARAPLGVVGPVARLAPALNDLSAESIKSRLVEDLWNRNGYGGAATAMIRRYPWGVGVGSFQSLLPEFAFASDRQMPPDNAQNWYRHQVAELGFVGSIPWVVWVAAFGLFVLRPRGSREPRLWVARGMLVAIAAISWVGMPGQDAAVAITFWTMAFWFVRLAGLPPSRPLPPAHWAAIAAVLLGYGAGTTYAAATDLRVPVRAQRGGWPYSYGFSPPIPEEGSAGGWTGRRAVAVMEAPTRWMRLNVSVDHRAIAGAGSQPPASQAPTRPADVKVWFNGELVVDERFTTTSPVSIYAPIPEERRWVMVETWVSRLVRPRDFGIPDDRELGLLVDWAFVPQPPESWARERTANAP